MMGKCNCEAIIVEKMIIGCVSYKMRNEVGYVISSQVINCFIHDCQFLFFVPSS